MLLGLWSRIQSAKSLKLLNKCRNWIPKNLGHQVKFELKQNKVIWNFFTTYSQLNTTQRYLIFKLINFIICQIYTNSGFDTCNTLGIGHVYMLCCITFPSNALRKLKTQVVEVLMYILSWVTVQCFSCILCFICAGFWTLRWNNLVLDVIISQNNLKCGATYCINWQWFSFPSPLCHILQRTMLVFNAVPSEGSMVRGIQRLVPDLPLKCRDFSRFPESFDVIIKSNQIVRL